MSNRVVRRRTRTGRGDASAARTAIERALAAGDVPGAAALAEAALSAGASDATMLNLAAWRREEAGDYRGAHALLRQALALAPGDVLIAGSIGAVLRKEGRHDDALAVLDRVVAAAPRHAAAWLERGYTLEALKREQEAGESYRRALALDPALAPAHGRLADAAARRGRGDQARDHAARALALEPHEPAARAALATVALEARDGAAAEALLRPLLDRVRGDDRTRTLTLLGDALDRQDRVAAAFDCYRAAQGSFRDVYRDALAPGPGRPSHRAFVERIAAQLGAPRAPAPGGDVPGAAATHVFLLGYPRSGTTLVENVLASAPGVTALEERDTLAAADDALIGNDGAMPDLAALDPALRDRLRADYWQRVAAMGAATTGTFVDMNPLNGTRLPIIAALFPAARVLVMRRDPRDVVLSCYRINFTPSPAAWAFSDLEEAARHYDALMTLTERARATLPLAFHDVRYDRLVTDFAPTVRAMADFIGLPWTDDFERFDRTAQRRGVRTASATQVRRGLFDGRGQWRRYADQLAPVLPILQPWVERFGFDS
ncbi:sulfotransferase [Sphingomonas sp. BK580]|uniref:tetratricopeptide repeat-containing sulfotransferase family protein n=1 Tax=Sphingomonas sp. BK580 TaxID=2586972 RepID=UPI00161F5F8D|nr:sulfotransferase [Sphingomonas sp. BK580]MBB3695770.1 tetratricopeptide (TPR) repeat protein [Sphingomonas sp. BK580]